MIYRVKIAGKTVELPYIPQPGSQLLLPDEKIDVVVSGIDVKLEPPDVVVYVKEKE